MAYWYTINARTFRPYSERPTTNSEWATFIKSATNLSSNTGSLYKTNIYQLDYFEDSNRNSSSTQGYVAFGNNTNNTSFDVFFVATTDTYGMGPFYFNIDSGISKAAEFGGYNSGLGNFGVWKVGTIYASSRDTAVKFNDFCLVSIAPFYDADKYQKVDYWQSTDSISVPSALKERIQRWTENGGSYSGCCDITASATIASTVTMGKDNVVVNITANRTPASRFSMVLNTLSKVQLTTAYNIISWNTVLPYSLEQYFLDNELRKQTNIQCVISYKRDVDNDPVFINGVYQPYADEYYYTTSNFYLQIDSTKLPSITSVSGTKDTKHKSKYVMLMDGNDKIAIKATIKDQSYAYNNDYNNYSPTFALYVGDANQGNYRPTSVSSSGNTLTTTYDFTWGPITVNPAVSLGTNQYIRIVYQDRFGRQASSNVTLTVNGTSVAYQRFYNYVNPTWGVTARRVNSSGTTDEKNGTYIKIEYNWALSLLDYSMSPNTGTARPTLKITNNQDSSTVSYTITSASGSNSTTWSSKPLDKSYTLTATLVDSAGREFVLNTFVPSGEVFMDFMSGGSGLGIGKRAEKASTLSVAWDTEIKKNLSVDGTISGPTIDSLRNSIPSIPSSYAASKITVASPASSLGTNVQSALDSIKSSLDGMSGSSLQGWNYSIYQAQPLRWTWIWLPVAGSSWYAGIGIVSHVNSTYFARNTNTVNFTVPITPPSGYNVNVMWLNGIGYHRQTSSTAPDKVMIEKASMPSTAADGTYDPSSKSVTFSVSTGSNNYSYFWITGFVVCSLTKA